MKQVGLRCLCIQKPVNYLHIKEVVQKFKCMTNYVTKMRSFSDMNIRQTDGQ